MPVHLVAVLVASFAHIALQAGARTVVNYRELAIEQAGTAGDLQLAAPVDADLSEPAQHS